MPNSSVNIKSNFFGSISTSEILSPSGKQKIEILLLPKSVGGYSSNTSGLYFKTKAWSHNKYNRCYMFGKKFISYHTTFRIKNKNGYSIKYDRCIRKKGD